MNAGRVRPVAGASIIHLVRHAEHLDFGQRLSGRGSAHGLSATGQAQAESLSRCFSGLGLDVIETSPQARTRETATAIATRTGRPPVLASALDEVDFGRWTGLTFSELDADPRWHTWNAHRGSARAPGGESMAQAQSRVVKRIEAFRAVSGSRVVLITHAEMIRAAVLHYLGLALDAWSRIEISPASVTTLCCDPGSVRLHALNERASL